MAQRAEPIGSFDHLRAERSKVRSETRKSEGGLIDLLESLHSLYWECFGLLRGHPCEGDVERAVFVVSTAAFLSLQGSLELIEMGYYAQAAVLVRLLIAEYLLCVAFRHTPGYATLYLSEPHKRVPSIGKLLEEGLAHIRLSDETIEKAKSDMELLHRHAHGATMAVLPEVVGPDPDEGLWHYPRYDEERCRWSGSRAAVWGVAVLALLTDHFHILSDDPQWTAQLLRFDNQLGSWHQQAIVHSEVMDALDQAEARGEKKVRVIVGLRPGSSLNTLKDALQRLGMRECHRESESFLALQLSREELLQVSELTDHISRIWLDRPISAAQ